MEEQQILQKINLDFARAGIPPRVFAKQGDNNMRVVAVSLYNDGKAYKVPGGYAVNVSAKKPDGKSVYNPATEVAGNVAYITLTQQTLHSPARLTRNRNRAARTWPTKLCLCFPPPAPQRKPRKALQRIFPAGGSTAKHGKARRKPRLSRSAWPQWKILWSQSWRANTHEQILYHRAAAVSAAQNHRRPGVGVHRKRPAQNHRRRSAGNLRPARQR